MINFFTDHDLDLDIAKAKITLDELAYSSMNGWMNVGISQEEVEYIKGAANKIRSDSQYLVCIGIGGSYLGHRAMIEAIGAKSNTQVIYAGNSLSSKELQKVLNLIQNAHFSINVISKSGTTMEPGVAFRILKQKLLERYGPDEARTRIYATTDKSEGALFHEAVANGYYRFVVPDTVGGRYSVLTAVGLLPMAVAGLDIDAMLAGAREEYQNTIVAINEASAELKQKAEEEAAKYNLEHPDDPPKTPDIPILSASAESSNILRYAASRYALANRGFDVEVLASFEPSLAMFNEWWKQLFGESEGKNNQGIFPASTIYTTDLHSLGQYMQEGRRNIFETIIKVMQPAESITVPPMSSMDGLDYVAGRSLEYINSQAMTATIQAHRNGGIPVFEIKVPDMTEKSIGALIYFFELSCAISAKMQGVNPFNQPGVEAYKKEMFRLLGRPQAKNQE